MAGLPLGTGGTSHGGNKMQYFYKLIDPPWSWLARQAPPPPHSDNKYHGGRKHAGNSSSFTLHISTTSKNRYTYSSIETLSKIIGLQGYRCVESVFKLSSDLPTTVLIPIPEAGEYETRGSNYPGEGR